MKPIDILHIGIIPFAALFTACSSGNNDYDATGVFEATEVTVSAEQTGKLLKFDVSEGSNVKAGAEVGLVDTVQLYLKARQIGATKLVYSAQMPETQKQIASLRQQLDKAIQEETRFTTLVNEGAANQKVLDDARNQVAVLQKQLDAQLSTLQNSRNSLSAQMSTADVQQLMVVDQLQKCHISSPIDGVVLEKYAECGEFTAIGKPLFKVADINNIYLRAYITADQLTSLKLGQKIKVYADQGKTDRKEYEGTLTWIADKAEFTPKTIQTRDERANLVYAIKVSVKNDGLIKMGMYGELKIEN